MACREIISPLTGETVKSKTWDDIYNLVGQNEQEADRLYEQMSTPIFIRRFGNWIENPSTIIGQVNEYGEPVIKSLQDLTGFQGNVVQARFKLAKILDDSKIQGYFKNQYLKGNKEKFLSEVTPIAGKQQTELLRQHLVNNTYNSLSDMVTGLLSEMSYTVEINTTKGRSTNYDYYTTEGEGDKEYEYTTAENEEEMELLEREGWENYGNEDGFPAYRRKYNNDIPNSSYYSNLTVQGGTNYTENEIATPAITPSIKGHAQFSTDNGIGWFRSDDKSINSKTRRILEVQSDLFQKGRNKEILNKLEGTDSEGLINGYTPEERGWITDEDIKDPKNQFLQLLNKDNNWVTFFIKSIIQDSIKKGYEKVLFPLGNTASKIEGHSTLEEFKKEKEDRIEYLRKQIADEERIYNRVKNDLEGYTNSVSNMDIVRQSLKRQEDKSNEIKQLELEIERVNSEGITALKPIYNFYENTVSNILKKLGTVETITDEYGNRWNQLTLSDSKLSQEIEPIYYLPLANNTSVPAVGIYNKFLNYKKNLLATLNERASRVRSEKRRTKDTAELARLTSLEHRINERINGSEEKGITGLKEEIAILEKNPNEMAVRDYIISDLQRLDNLLSSMSFEGNQEAEKIINFIEAAGNFVEDRTTGLWKPVIDAQGLSTNPLFDGGEYFKAAIEPFLDWAAIAKSQRVVLEDNQKNVITQSINNNPKLKSLLGPQTYDQIMSTADGLKDTNWLDMWIMDVSNGIFSHNGIIPQVMLDELSAAIEQEKAWPADIEKRMNELTPKVEAILREMKNADGSYKYRLSVLGILKVSGVSYDLFKQKNIHGLDTGALVSRYSDKFYNARQEMMMEYERMMDDARGEQDSTAKGQKFAKAAEFKKGWLLKNTIMLDPRKLMAVISNTEFAGFSSHFNAAESANYEKALIDMIGQRAFDEEVNRQVEQLKKYKVEEQVFIDEYLMSLGKPDLASLNAQETSTVNLWIRRNNPFYGVQDFFARDGIQFGTNRLYTYMNHNITIPRKETVAVGLDANNNYIFGSPVSGAEGTGYWDGQYEQIESSQDLFDFHKLLESTFKTMRDNMPENIYNKVRANSIPVIRQAIIEILTDENIPILQRISKAFREIWNRIRESFGIVKDGDMSYANVDVVTGKPNYEVNSQFFKGNNDKINSLFFIEKREFLSLYNTTIAAGIKDINKYTTLDLNVIGSSKPLVIKLAQYLNTEATVDAIRNRLGSDVVPINKIIRSGVIHQVVQEQSLDLPKIAKYFANLTAVYRAKNKVLPALLAMKEHYEMIKTPIVNNSGQGIMSIFTGEKLKGGLRGNANKQMNDWFNRVALGNYDRQDFGVAEGKEGVIPVTPKEKAKYIARTLTGQNVSHKYYVGEEANRLQRINKLIENESDPKVKERLEKMKDKMGRVLSVSSMIEGFLNFIRLRGLGYNLSSGLTNFLEGTVSNIITAASGDYFNPDLLGPAYRKVAANFIAYNSTLGKVRTGDGKKIVALMERYRVLQDSSNELQKSSIKTNFSWTRNLAPYEVTRRVEFVNQSPLMVAMLMDRKIKDKNGNESSVYDAMDEEGNLLPDYRTQDNINSWEGLNGNDYRDFKSTLDKAIVRTHGNYDDKRGMMIKSSAFGKALAMFKTWLPQALQQRFATEQVDLASGLKSYKGRYRSFTPGSGAVFGGLAGLSIAGPLAFPIGAVIGATAARMKGTVPNNMDFLHDMAYTGKALAKKMFGMPVNFIAGRKVINSNSDFANYGFSQQDARNLRANVADMAILLGWIALTLMAKAAFWDDDDKSDSARRMAHNLFVNRFTQLASQAEMFVNPRTMWDGTVGDLAIIKWYDDIVKLAVDFNKAAHGDDTIVGGINAGQSATWNQFKKTFVPGMFRDGRLATLGFENQAQQEFPAAKAFPFNRYFWGDKKVAKRNISEIRAEHKVDLMEEGLEGDALDDQMKSDIGRKKKGQSYEDFEEQLEERRKEWDNKEEEDD